MYTFYMTNQSYKHSAVLLLQMPPVDKQLHLLPEIIDSVSFFKVAESAPNLKHVPNT
jgi:hypothetical protein